MQTVFVQTVFVQSVILQTSVMATEIESGHGEKAVYRKMAEYKKKIALVEVILEWF